MSAPAEPFEAEAELAKELINAQIAALRRLGRLAADSPDAKVALRAAEAVLTFAGRCHRGDARGHRPRAAAARDADTAPRHPVHPAQPANPRRDAARPAPVPTFADAPPG